MPDCTDLLDRARRNPAGLRFVEVCDLAECFGFEFKRQKGTSHRLYKKPGAMALMNFQAEKNGMAKDYQVRQLLREIKQILHSGPDDE
jgi:predicted RNA binding protein YcfA (HicA-like mRNA interferase family)